MRKPAFTTLLISTLIAAASAQDFGWAMRGEPQNPGDVAGFFPIGWACAEPGRGACAEPGRGAVNGNLFAYATFDYSMSIATSCNLSVSVRDMVTDKLVWWYTRGWEESLRGEGDDPAPPRSAGTAWDLSAHEVLPQLLKLGIAPGGPAAPDEFPVEEGGDALTLEILESEDGDFTVRINSEKLGGKVIAKEHKNDPQNRLSVLGYYRSPQNPRIAVVLREELSRRRGYASYYVIGCHLKSGFRR
jgi:hypothetical protein